MKYIEKYENFKPIKINNEEEFENDIPSIWNELNRNDKVVCVYNTNKETELTIGKEYVIKYKGSIKNKDSINIYYFCIINDIGDEVTYLIKRFVTPTEYQQMKFNL